MPEYRSINFELHSQFEVERIPEMDPFPQEHYTSRGVTRPIPKAVDEASSTRSVYVPVYPGSMFWIRYLVSPPVPDSHYFLFKLYINGTHIVSWSTGKEEEWTGKTMFGLFERPEDEDGKKRMEKRVLSFTTPDQRTMKWTDVKDAFEDNMSLEIKVHRAHGRMRIEREIDEYSKTPHAQDAKGIHLVNAGRAGSEQPKRFYKFALIDPVDQPFATFRFYYRTKDQLRDLGFQERDWRTEREENDMPVIEPIEDTHKGDEGSSHTSFVNTEDIYYECPDGDVGSRGRPKLSSANSKQLQLMPKPRSLSKRDLRHKPSLVETIKLSTAQSSQPLANPLDEPRAYVPRGAPGARGTSDEPRQHVRKLTHNYRLSVPPSIRLNPPDETSRSLPTIPLKSTNSQFSIAYRRHPAYPVEEWRKRTPSPIRPIREGLSTPPLEKRRESSRASSLISAISSTWRRRGAASAKSEGSAVRPGGARGTTT